MYDLIIKGGTVADGTGEKPFVADVCVKNGIIAEICENAGTDAATVIDAAGKTVSPGFIDIHSHSDTVPFGSYLCDGKLQQGVTTEIAGNCGSSPLPATKESIRDVNIRVGSGDTENGKARYSIADYAEDINKKGTVINIGMLVGHSPLRIAYMGYRYEEPTEEEMQKIEALLDRELSRGCFGLSFGLIYPPSAFSKREEILRLARVVKKHGAIMAVHMRNEGPRIFEAVEEMISIAKESGVHIEISHLKLMGKPQWKKAKELTAMIEKAQSEGADITCDQYPFLASSTSLNAVLPHWAHEGGYKKRHERVLNPTDELKHEIAAKIAERGGANTILIVTAKGCPQYSNKYLSDVMSEYGLSDVDAALKVMGDSGCNANCNYFCIDEEDMLTIMKKTYVSVGSDGTARTYDKSIDSAIFHPRHFATFPKFFETVREKSLMPIETAVYKCTGLPAKVLGIKDRGILKKGMIADITVFDNEKIKSNSSFTDSRVKPEGIEYVIIGGKTVLDHKKVLCETAGKVILREE